MYDAHQPQIQWYRYSQWYASVQVHGAGVSRQALDALKANKTGRSLQVEDAKHRWWVAAEG